ncbi:MAG: hypothetical protein B5M46_02555 [Epsilonproteobacteria bacterium 4484_20]|nr:MAG: hypothetical protein B5M46_02555 [Epsilonproteobacteria bacterium 4484_20]
MTITIHQPETYPWLGFFNKMMLAEEYIILDNVKFRKNYFQNRNQFLIQQKAVFLTVPVEKDANSKLIHDIKIAYVSNWRKKHLNTIKQNYAKAPFFDQHKAFFDTLYNQKFEFLVDFNMTVIRYIREVLGITTPLLKASELEVGGDSTLLLLNICKKRKADIYISGRDGRNYLDVDMFENNHIKIVYHQFIHPEYTQFNTNDFMPYMSTFDLLFNYSAEEAREIILKGGTICEE